MGTAGIMDADTEKLERFVRAVNSEVDKVINGIIGEAVAVRDEMIQSAKDESLTTAYNIIQDNIKKVSSKYLKIVAKTELDSKKEILLKREALAQQVFENIKEKLLAFRETPSYAGYLAGLVRSENIAEKAVIFLRGADMKFSDEIQKAVGVPVEFQVDPTIKIGGLSVLYSDRGIIADKTMDLALSEQREIFNGKNCFA